MKNLENQIGQLASNLNNKPPGKLLGDNQVPRMDDGKECKVVKLRSGKELSDPDKVPQVGFKKPDGSQCMEDETDDGQVEVQKVVPQPTPPYYVPKISYPQRQ